MNFSKKLIYIANLRLSTERAYGIQIAKMCEAFASQDMDVTLFFPFRKNDIRDNIFSYYSIKQNFKTKKLWAPDFYLPGKINILALGLKNFISAIILSIYAMVRKPDIIYSRDELPLFLLSFFRKNLIYEAHRFSSSRGLFYRRFKNINLKVVVITKRLKEDFVKIGFKQENILVASDGVDLAEFDIDISKEEARIRVGLPLDKKIVMYAGHLFEWKGAGVLLEAAKIYNLQPTTYNPLFVFVGGTDRDIKKFREKAEGMSNVLIVGHKPHKEMPIYLKAVDILILPNSAKEEISKYTSPLKLFEYMASGRPIVVSDLASLREVLNEDNAIFVKSDDPDSLAEGIKKILDNDMLGDKISQKARFDAEGYTWQKRAETMLNFIKP